MGQHAILSASASKRWMNCTPSALLEKQFADEESIYAAEGTAAHALAEHKLKRFLKKRSKRPVSDYDCDEMEECTDDSGVLLYMRQEGRGIGLVNKLKAYHLQDNGMDTLDANLALGFQGDLREYYIGAQILRDLGIKSLHLLTNNPDKVYQLEDYGMKISSRVPIEIEANPYDSFYLKTKKDRMGHILNMEEK